MCPDIAHAPLIVGKAGFDDMDQQAAQLSGYDQLYRQLSPGRFRGEFSTVAVPNKAGLFVETSNRIVEQGAMVPRDQWAILFMLEGEQPARFGRRPFHPNQCMVLPPGSEIDFRNALDTSICVIAANVEDVGQRSEADFGRPRLRETVRLDHPDLLMPLVSATRGVLNQAFAPEFDRPHAAAVGALASNLVDLVASVLRRGAAQSRIRGQGSTDTRPDLFRRARNRIHMRLDRVTIGDLEQHLYVSRRTLEYAFAEAAGLGPRRYIAMMRLNAVRRDLLRGAGTIGDLAARYGIWHLGRFSAAYSAAFGELPSETRRRAG